MWDAASAWDQGTIQMCPDGVLEWEGGAPSESPLQACSLGRQTSPSPGLAAAWPLRKVMPRAEVQCLHGSPGPLKVLPAVPCHVGLSVSSSQHGGGVPGGSKPRVKGGERKAPETQPLLPSLRRRACRRWTQVPGSWPRKGEGAAQAAGAPEEFIKHRRENEGEGTRLTPKPVLGPAPGSVQTDPAMQICTTFSKS